MDRIFVRRVALISVALMAFGSGCQGPLVQQREHEAEQMSRELVYIKESQRVLQEENRQLKGRLEGIEIEMNRLASDHHAQRSRSDESMRVASRDQEARVAALERQLQQLARQREQDKKEIVDTLSQKIAGLMQPPTATGRRTAQAPPSGQRTARSEYGYEHVVKPGQTLSEIAAAYGVSVAVLIRENDIRDPNRLQAGQKLFIPE